MQNFSWYDSPTGNLNPRLRAEVTQGRHATPIRDPGTTRIIECFGVRAGLRGQDEKPCELHPRKPYNGCVHMGWNTLHDSQMISGLMILIRIKGDGLQNLHALLPAAVFGSKSLSKRVTFHCHAKRLLPSQLPFSWGLQCCWWAWKSLKWVQGLKY